MGVSKLPSTFALPISTAFLFVCLFVFFFSTKLLILRTIAFL